MFPSGSNYSSATVVSALDYWLQWRRQGWGHLLNILHFQLIQWSLSFFGCMSLVPLWHLIRPWFLRGQLIFRLFWCVYLVTNAIRNSNPSVIWSTILSFSTVSLILNPRIPSCCVMGGKGTWDYWNPQPVAEIEWGGNSSLDSLQICKPRTCVRPAASGPCCLSARQK